MHQLLIGKALMGAKQADRGGQPFWDLPVDDVFHQVRAGQNGLAGVDAAERLRQYGPNALAGESHWAPLVELLRLFLNPLVLILLVAGVISLVLGERISAGIIIVIVLISILLNYVQSAQARRAVAALQREVALTAAVVRDGKEQEVPVASLVPGDLLQLNAGDLVPADARLISAKDLHVREAALTGESFPVEKHAGELPAGTHTLSDADNSVFMGTAVQSGIGSAVVVHTGKTSALGEIASRLTVHPPATEFDRGIRNFGLLVTRIILVLVVFVFLINAILRGHDRSSLFESFLFAVALAVGLTPELLPMILTITLAQGARRMARRKVIVKQLESIENFGSMEILCSDKTGTLTEGEITLDRHVDPTGRDDEHVLQLLYLNSYFEAGIKSPLDEAVLKHTHATIDEYRKVDEMPFDFTRKRLSVVVQHGDERLLVTKGEVEGLLPVCMTVNENGTAVPFDAEHRKAAEETYHALSKEGYRVLGVATRRIEEEEYTTEDECEMTLEGFGAFLDPPKPAVAETLEALARDGIRVIIMTGDNAFVTEKIAHDVRLPFERIITGEAVNGMSDDALAVQADRGTIFARVTPEQKNRVITALQRHGRVVGFLGDGINDAPSLHAADIGISVVGGVDVAKAAANIILLEKDLRVLHDGVLEGRRSFANIMKYIIMGTSSNFGNMFSMAGASLFLPYLPMLPTQILLNNLLYDFSQIAIPTDRVDPDLLQRPKRWRTDFIRNFMLIIGPISSLYDFATFGILLLLFHANETLFHTGWFVESLATQTLVVFVIRTAANPLRSRPGGALFASVLAIVAIAVILPYTPLGRLFGFVPLPLLLLAVIFGLMLTYLLLVQLVKNWFYRRYQIM